MPENELNFYKEQARWFLKNVNRDELCNEGTKRLIEVARKLNEPIYEEIIIRAKMNIVQTGEISYDRRDYTLRLNKCGCDVEIIDVNSVDEDDDY